MTDREKPILCVDWGTSSFRAALVDPSSTQTVSGFQTDQGCKPVFQQSQKSDSDKIGFFISILVEQLRSANIDAESIGETVISGMASSSIGMMELPYAPLPFAVDGNDFISRSFNDDQLGKVTLLSGVADEEDIMRGEETQLVGLRDHLTQKESIVVLPGTHSKHLRLENGQLVRFHSFMTGELFQLLSNQSVVSLSVSSSEWSGSYESAVREGAQDAIKGNLLNSTFKIRARDILGKSNDSEANYYYLSGLIVGAELQSLRSAEVPKIFACDAKLKPLYEVVSQQLELSDCSFLDPDVLSSAYIHGQLAILKR